MKSQSEKVVSLDWTFTYCMSYPLKKRDHIKTIIERVKQEEKLRF